MAATAGRRVFSGRRDSDDAIRLAAFRCSPGELRASLRILTQRGKRRERDMKNLVAIVSGFVLALGVFAGGALTTIFFVNANPTPVRSLDGDTDALWTNRAVVVNAHAGNLERLPARSVPQRPSRETEAQAPSAPDNPAGNPKPALDSTMT